MGWDAFGLPAENAARERAINPKLWTQSNIAEMRSQLDTLGCAFNWESELGTCDPSYYRWTQYLFLQLFQCGLAERKMSYVNWDPADCTVLANEQIDQSGRSWRSGAPVEKKLLNQWFIRTSRFAQDLFNELDNLKDWHGIVNVQKDWIGVCNGYKFHLPIQVPVPVSGSGKCMELFVKDPSLFKEDCFVLINPEHVCAQEYLDKYSRGTRQILPIRALLPCSDQSIPIILSDEQSGEMVFDARLGVPSKFQEDLEISKLVGLKFAETGVQSVEDVISEAQKLNRGGYKCSEKSVDWVVSRQRYWGTPIPIIHCQSCGEVPVPLKDLPVTLPPIDNLDAANLKSSGTSSPLQNFPDWVNTICPRCLKPAKRECDTLDTFFDSSWYFLRYLDPKNNEEPFNKEKADQWLPVHVYVGGREHAVMHLYFARFMAHFLYWKGLIGVKEPFKRLLPQGMVKGKTFLVEDTGRYVAQENVIQEKKGIYIDKDTGECLTLTWEKMSKSKLNGINPMNTIHHHGTDMTRLITIAGGSPQQDKLWTTDISKGLHKWLYRIWWLVNAYLEQLTTLNGCREVSMDAALSCQLNGAYNDAVRVVTYHMNITHLFNVVIARLQTLTNVLRKVPPEAMSSMEYERCLECLIIMLYPFAPHISLELWNAVKQLHETIAQSTSQIQHLNNFQEMKWPIVDADSDLELEFKQDLATLSKMKLSRREMGHLTIEQALQFASEDPKLKKILKGKSIIGGELTFVDEYGAMLMLDLHSPQRKK